MGICQNMIGMRSMGAALVIAAGAIVLPAAVAAGANLNSGVTMEPLPGGSLSGGTLEQTITKTYSFMTTAYVNSPAGPIPVPRPLSGTVTQRVYRLADNSITFTYTISNDSDSQAEPTDLYMRDFAEYTTDVFQYNGIQVITNQSANRAERSVDGSSVQVTWDAGINPGNNGRTLYVKTNATAYSAPGRYVPVSSRATVCVGGTCQNIYGFAYPVEDSTPPIVSLTAPAQLSSVCNPAAITGTAYDPNGFDQYVLAYSSNPNGPWTTITTSSTAVSSPGTLGSWNTTAVPQGYYFVRLTAANTTGMETSVTSMVYVDKQFDTVQLRSPVAGQILGGGVCFDGTVSDANGTVPINNYKIEYAPLPAGSPFAAVDPANPQYTQMVQNDGLGAWQTASGPAAVADGPYRVRVTGTDHCGYTRSVSRDIIIDNTAPVAAITSPSACGAVGHGIVQITGSASDAHMAGWALQYSGGDSAGWVTIASGSSNVSGVLANWNTAGLRPCAYTLRLVAGDAAGVNCSGNNNQTEVHVSVNVGCAGDFNRSGDATVQDIFDFLQAYFAGCP
jgi:hypothetical protein